MRRDAGVQGRTDTRPPDGAHRVQPLLRGDAAQHQPPASDHHSRRHQPRRAEGGAGVHVQGRGERLAEPALRLPQDGGGAARQGPHRQQSAQRQGASCRRRRRRWRTQSALALARATREAEAEI